MKTALSFIVAIACGATGLVWAAGTGRTNLVFIMTDDQGVWSTGCYGNPEARTPTIDRLATEGVRFRRAYATIPVCSPSRATFLTGRLASQHGVHDWIKNENMGDRARYILDREVLLSQVLAKHGYTCGLTGKWHLGDSMRPHADFSYWFAMTKGSDVYNDTPMIWEGKVSNQPGYITDRITDHALKFLDANKERPFFFYLAHSMPHVPLFVSDKFRGKSKQGLYGDVIMEIDWSVGEVMKALKRHKLEANTLVIFTSDNGPWLSYGNHAGSAGPLREGKGTSWEGGTRVPCIMRWPGNIPAGTTSDAMLMTIDLLPTIAALAGAELPPRPIDGRAVWPLITGAKDAKNPHEAYWFYYHVNQLQSVVSGDGRWKLVLPHQYRTLAGWPGGTNGIPTKYEPATIATPELYDLLSDVGETRNVVETRPEIVGQLMVQVEKARLELGDSLTRREGLGTREPGRLPEPNRW